MSYPTSTEIKSAGNMVIENVFNYIFCEWDEIPTKDELNKLVYQFGNTNRIFSKLSFIHKIAFFEMIFNSVCYTITTEKFISAFKNRKK